MILNMQDIEKENYVYKEKIDKPPWSAKQECFPQNVSFLIQFDRVLTWEIFHVFCIIQNKRLSQNIKLHFFLPLFKLMGTGTMHLSMTIIQESGKGQLGPV